MKTADNVGVTFVNAVVGRGIFNNVINLSLGTLLFTPVEGDKGAVSIDPDLVITSRLRMDKVCAQQLHEALGVLLQSIAQAEAANGHDMLDAAEKPAETKPN